MTPITFQLITGLEATSKNKAGRDEKQFVAISIFFFLISFNFALHLYYSLKEAF